MVWSKQIVEQYGQEYIFRQLAEEAAELCQASLKMVRVMNNETPLKWHEAKEHLLEEIADVSIMTDMLTGTVLTQEDRFKIETIRAEKEKRMRKRMLEE